MRIDYATRARLGVLVPSGNTVAEPELRAMLPPGVGLFVTRLPLTGSSEPELLAMLETLETGTQLLADAQPDAIAFHCTAVSTFAPHMAGEIRGRMGRASPILALATADAILAALAALRAKRVLLVTPYIEPVHQREIAWLTASGFDVVGGGCMDIATNAEMARIPAEAIRDRVLSQARDTQADVCFISCTAIRSAGLIAPLEATLDMPVITSNTDANSFIEGMSKDDFLADKRTPNAVVMSLYLLVLFPVTSFAQSLFWQSAFALTLWGAVAVVLRRPAAGIDGGVRARSDRANDRQRLNPP
jgi:maleate isomerase